ncbi:metallophosphoesterase [Thiomicrorhabdus sp. ZW0627]|uniref:metallophosphoesterase n=1 Tax=Thiomicrorhabdus sp. ZW0627 TaxID=3039774 RepID=UPI002436BDDC|nr:metallophosphoesterase [Thiomicrorhabdus sp. ZW0627]MDG6773716.1 metallophosphoesterase [Thiomicrorhabdus sp. ZW0627]
MYTADIIPWTTDETVHLPVNQWQFPNKDIYFFCDLHADAAAFLRSLQASFLVTTDSRLDDITLTTQGQHAQIVIGGDCFDKGPSNLALFRLLSLLREQHADLVLLAGNHDIRVYAGLSALDLKQDPFQSHFFTRMGRKTAALFAEIHRQYCQNESTITLDENEIIDKLFPNEEWFERFPEHARSFMTEEKIQKEIKQIRFKQQDFLDACHKHGLNLIQVYQAVEKARELFIDPQGEFSWFFKEIKLLHRSGSYLFCHAGLDDSIAQRVALESADRLNRDFQQQLDHGKLFEIYYSEFGNVFRTKYRASDKPLTVKGTQALKQAGIYALVNGHRSHKNGQQLFIRNGLLNFECDTQLNENCRKKNKISTLGYSSTIFFANGLVSAMSSDIPKAKMFHPKHLKKA